TPDTPMPCGQEGRPGISAPPIQFEPLPPTSTHNRLPGTIVIQEEEDIRPTGVVSSPEPEECEVPEQVRELMKRLAHLESGNDFGVEVSLPAAPFMPYCEDDEPT